MHRRLSDYPAHLRGLAHTDGVATELRGYVPFVAAPSERRASAGPTPKPRRKASSKSSRMRVAFSLHSLTRGSRRRLGRQR
jgi:hypothetical protein